MKLNRRNILQLGAAAAASGIVPFGSAGAQESNVIRIGIAAGRPRHSDPNYTTQGSDNWATEQMYEQLVRPEDGTFATKPRSSSPRWRRSGRRRRTPSAGPSSSARASSSTRATAR
jgi:peptide/nickel transport system substrate-binding protein